MSSDLPGERPPVPPEGDLPGGRPPVPAESLPGEGQRHQAGGTPLLEVRDLVVHHGQLRALSGISLTVYPGEVYALIGANGAGKSTLVLAVAGLLRASAGSVMLGDRELAHLRPEQVRSAGVAVVPEGRRLLSELTVEENLRVATYALSKEHAKDGIAYALELFPELEKRWGMPARLLSGGEQQMVVLAQALVSRPRIILVDELSLGLAPVVVKRLVPTLEAVAASGVGVLLIEQFAHVALALAETAYVIEGGRIRYEGTAQRLKDEPELLHSAYLLRDVPAGAENL
jgi:branched-chain amino acid transport system ATP-binding protein